MMTLLRTISNELRSDPRMGYMADRIYLADDPPRTQVEMLTPALAIKDEGEQPTVWLSSQVREEWKTVGVRVYHEVGADRGPMESGDVKSILEIAADVRDVLDGNRLGRYDEMQYVGSDPAGPINADEDEFLWSKDLHFRWLLRSPDVRPT